MEVYGCLWMLVNEGAWRFISEFPIQGNVGREILANGNPRASTEAGCIFFFEIIES